MNIGLDIDNVITDLDIKLIDECLKEDKNKRNSGILDAKAHIERGMFDWSQDEFDDFWASNMESFAKDVRMRRNCKKYMDRLIADGHRLILISNRVYPHYNNPEKTTIDWMQKHKINYTKLVLSKTPDKTNECKENNIDIMVDDRVGQCKKMRANGIKCIVMLTRANRSEVEDMPYASSWRSLYEEITKLC